MPHTTVKYDMAVAGEASTSRSADVSVTCAPYAQDPAAAIEAHHLTDLLIVELGSLVYYQASRRIDAKRCRFFFVFLHGRVDVCKADVNDSVAWLAADLQQHKIHSTIDGSLVRLCCCCCTGCVHKRHGSHLQSLINYSVEQTTIRASCIVYI